MIGTSPIKFPNLPQGLISPSKPGCKPSLLSANRPQWFSIIILLLFHISSSFSTPHSEHQAELWSRARLSAREVRPEQRFNQTIPKCQPPTCKSTKPPQAFTTATTHVIQTEKAIHHKAKISRQHRSTRSLKSRDCGLTAAQKTLPPTEGAHPSKSTSKPKPKSKPQKTEQKKRPFPSEKQNLPPIPTPSAYPKPQVTPKPLLNIIPPAIIPSVKPETNKPIQRPSRIATPSTVIHKNSKDFNEIDRWLSAHNTIRAKHSARSLTWSTELQATAQKLADTCIFDHSNGIYGENIAAGYATLEDVVNDWVFGTDECGGYDTSNPTYSHFTQVVWLGTQKLGCARSACDKIQKTDLINSIYWVCEYDPPGNYLGEFLNNVNVKAGACIGKPPSSIPASKAP